MGIITIFEDPDQRPSTQCTKPAVWRPTGCTVRYATVYHLPTTELEPPPVEAKKPDMVDASTGPSSQNLWCCGCMRFLVDPFSLSCGHTFCTGCIASLGTVLLQDFSEVVKDTRATIRCPVGKCRATMPALPLVNGDFRFKEKHITYVERPKRASKQREVTSQVTVTPVISPICLSLESFDNQERHRRSDDLFVDLEDMVTRMPPKDTKPL